MDKVDCKRCERSIDWEDLVLYGSELDWFINILPRDSLDIIKYKLGRLIETRNFVIFSWCVISGLIREIDDEVMCRREGINRIEWRNEKYERQQKIYQEQREKDEEGTDIVCDREEGAQDDKEEKGEVGDKGNDTEWV